MSDHEDRLRAMIAHERLLRDYAENGVGFDPAENAMLRWAMAEIDRLRAELAIHGARWEWFEARDVEVRRADEDDGPEDDDDGDEGEGDEPTEYIKWGVVVWAAGRARTSFGETLCEAVDAARAAEASP